MFLVSSRSRLDCRNNNMDVSKSNKTKNWLYRLRHLNIRNASDESCGKTGCTRTSSRNSFRRSLKRMHTRVKSVMCRKNTSSEGIYVTDVPPSLSTASSSLTLRISLREPIDLPAADQNARTTSSSPSGRRVPTDEIYSLSNRYWYWGPLTITQAEEKLHDTQDGAFLVRDSSSTSYLFSISFRSIGKTLHSRIEYNRGMYSLYGQEGFATISDLIENALAISESGIYCYSKTKQHLPNFPVRLLKPMSRYTKVPTLKYLCRFAIRQCTNINDIPTLPLPTVLYGYLQEGPYF